MRDPARIDRALNLISVIWHRYPDQRLGQLLINYAWGRDVDVFNREDDDTLSNLRNAAHARPPLPTPTAPAAVPRDTEARAPGEPRWRVGRKVGRTIYLDGHLFGVIDTAEAATMAVDALNGAAEVEALRSQLADKTRQLTELSTADGTNRWVAGKELEMIEALRGQVAKAVRLLEMCADYISHLPDCPERELVTEACGCGYRLMDERLDAYLASTSTRTHDEDMAERAARAVSERNLESFAGGAPAIPLDVRRPVAAFALLMEAKLRENDHKGGWGHDLPGDLLDRLHEETGELTAALAAPKQVKFTSQPTVGHKQRQTIGREAADIANFAMMIADVCGALASGAPVTTLPRDHYVREALEEMDAADAERHRREEASPRRGARLAVPRASTAPVTTPLARRSPLKGEVWRDDQDDQDWTFTGVRGPFGWHASAKSGMTAMWDDSAFTSGALTFVRAEAAVTTPEPTKGDIR